MFASLAKCSQYNQLAHTAARSADQREGQSQNLAHSHTQQPGQGPVSRMAFSLGQIPVLGNRGGGRIQPKLKINAPGDKYEQEADRIAEQVMRAPNGNKQAEFTPTVTGIQTKAAGPTGGETASAALSGRIQSSRGRGQAMDGATQSLMSSRLGVGLSGVRVHTGQEAARMNEAINARAFTVGRDIYFGQGEYRPHSGEGKQLLAHELVHVLQQRGEAHSGFIQKEEKKKEKKDTAEIVAKGDVKSGVSTELKAKSAAGKGVTEEASATTSAESEKLKAGFGYKPGGAFSFSGSLGGTRDLATSAATPSLGLGLKYGPKGSPFSASAGLSATQPPGSPALDPTFSAGLEYSPLKALTLSTGFEAGASTSFHLKLKGKGQPVDFISLEGSAGLKAKPGETPAVSADGKLVFVPDYIIAPHISGSVDTGKESASVGLGAKIRLSDTISLNVGVLGKIGFDGTFVPGASAGIVLPLDLLNP